MSLERRRVRVRGVVQGVGFRPFVYSLASELSLSGEVWNDPDGVVAVVQGAPRDVAAFCRRVASDAPPLADVHEVVWDAERPVPGDAFVISASQGSGGRTLVPADVATCEACLAEMSDPQDRRYRHPFITCTACGPRFTIVTALPYDRPMTTMAKFALCPDCAREYSDPGDRRFHAQPVSCHACGPVLELDEPGRPLLQREDALSRALALLWSGAVVAVKGVGGYHLACDATNAEAVDRLRVRKRRGGKPFAVLVPDLATARAICDVDDVEADLLASPRRPIVLLRRRRRDDAGGPRVAEGVAPANPDLGVMLPPSALHHLLFRPTSPSALPLQVLVLTSGNLASEPIATDDADARRRLGGLADAWLRHDRPIHVPCDDSVTRVVTGSELPIRRSRGYAPLPVLLPFEVPPTLAVGGDLKNTFAVAQGRSVWLSAHVGDMDDLATQETFERATEHLSALVDVRPQVLVADAHPGYRSSAWAQRRARSTTPGDAGLDLVRVQHHHAHMAAVMAEHGIDAEATVLGIAFDGTGYGDDAAVWGGEGLLGGYEQFERLAHLAYVPLAGGDTAVRRPYRMALAHLRQAGVGWDDVLPPVRACPPVEREVLAKQLATGLACVPTSSAGRLFDAVASLAGVCHEVDYEAQAAMELEGLARESVVRERGAYPLPLVPAPASASAPASAAGETLVWDCAVLIRAVAADVINGVPAGVVAARFHRGLAAAVVALGQVARARDVSVVVLSGGVFCNALLTSLVESGLRDAGLTSVRHRRVPPNDGGLALGQVVVGARRLRPSAVRSTSHTVKG